MSTSIGTSNNSATYKPQVNGVGIAQASNTQKLGNLFQQMDTSGSGRISKAQFDQSFSNLSLPISVKEMGKDAVFAKLDPNGTGTVTKQEFIQGMEPLMSQKDVTLAKKPPVEARPIPVVKEPETQVASKSQPNETSPAAEVKGIGNIINITA
jgi:hypothetical protein